MSTALQLISEKIRRAREHLKLFEDEAGTYFKDCGAILDIKVNPQMSQMALCLTIDKELPPRFSVIVGDCVHNARSALDNLICALSEPRIRHLHATGVTIPPSLTPRSTKPTGTRS